MSDLPCVNLMYCWRRANRRSNKAVKGCF